MLSPAAHRICRVVVACLVLAGLAARTPGEACCGDGTAPPSGGRAATVPVQKDSGGGCGHCSKADESSETRVATAQDDACPADAARDCGGGADHKEPCDRGACAAVCCHVNALTTAPPAVAALAEVAVPVAFADPSLPALADGDAIFHPPRA